MLNKTFLSALFFAFCYEASTGLKANAFSQNPSKNLQATHSKTSLNSKAETASLLSYLKTPSIPKEVKELVDKARENYKETFDFQWSQTVKWDAAGGGRPADWIEKIFSQKEEAIVQTLQTIPGPKTWTIQSIDQVYNQVLNSHNREQKGQIAVVEGVGVNGLHKVPLGQNSLVQLASQFNYLESPGPYKVPVSRYLYDLTQGPLGAIEATAAALHRYASEESGKLPHALHGLLPTDALPFYKHGYLMLAETPESLCKKIYEYMAAHIDHLEILPQWTLCEASDAMQMQIFSAAPSFQGKNRPNPGSWAEKIAILLVSKQYEALGKIAAIRSLLTKKAVPVHLTLVGQGVFNNPPIVLQKALQKFYEAVKGVNVQTYIHAFTSESRKSLESLLLQTKIPFQNMSRDQFQEATV